MVSSPLLLFGLASILLYVTPFVSGTYFNKTLVGDTRTPFEVVLGYYSNGSVYCGGSLITDYYVLTAAECVINRQRDNIEVFIAVTNLLFRYANNEVRLVDEIIIHGSYDPRKLWRNNIALLRLGPSLFPRKVFGSSGNEYLQIFRRSFSLGYVPVKHQLDSLLKSQEQLVKLSGHGIVSDVPVSSNMTPSFAQLMESFTYIIDWNNCKKMYKTIDYDISDTHICAYDPYIDAQDKRRISNVGNPLIINGRAIVGIALNVNKGSQLDSRYPILFTNVSYYRDWIEHTINRYDENSLTLRIWERIWRNIEYAFPYVSNKTNSRE